VTLLQSNQLGLIDTHAPGELGAAQSNALASPGKIAQQLPGLTLQIQNARQVRIINREFFDQLVKFVAHVLLDPLLL
jgi:hypothetical protein